MNAATRPRPRPTALTLALVLVLVVAGCTDGGGDDSPEPGAVTWEPCPDVPAEVVGSLAPPEMMEQLTASTTYDCATITVPRHWADPDGDTFEIALLRARADHQRDRIGSLVVNPGGPGASGIDSAVYLSFGATFGGLPDEVTERFDIVGFDPRGVDRSTPVDCISDADLDESFAAEPDPVDPDAFNEMLADQERTAQRCGQKYGETLRRYSTVQTAHDLEAVRTAVGDEQLTYLGFSYGTLLGGVYAQLYPDRIRAMVLDGAVDPTADPVEAARSQAEGFEQAFDSFAAWCAATRDQCPLGNDARGAVTAALEAARKSPVTGEDGRDATAGWILYAVVSALYTESSWPALAAAIDQLETGDPTGVFDLADVYADRTPDGRYSNMWDANRVISCADEAESVSVEQARALQQQWRQDLPLFGGPVALSVLTCYQWPVEPDPYPTGPARGAPPLLVVGTTGDPATPYESAQTLADMLGTGVVLTWQGEGHTAYPGSECVIEAVDAYLIDLAVPAEGTTCD